MSDTDQREIDRDEYGGPVNSDVSYFRNSGAIVQYPVIEGVTCHRCGSGEVWQPMQTMDMPMCYSCLRCGVTAAAAKFNFAGDEQ